MSEFEERRAERLRRQMAELVDLERAGDSPGRSEERHAEVERLGDELERRE